MTSSRHIPADADLTYFTVTCHLAPIVADLSQDSDYDPNTARIDAVVTFTPKYKAGEVIHSHTSTPPTGFLALPVTALIDDGYLKLRAKPDVGAAPLPGTLHGLKAKIAADTGQELDTDLRAALNYAPVRLLGNSSTLEIDPEIPLHYDFSFTNIKIDGKQTNYVITGGHFEAPWEDTVVDLLDWMPLSPGPYAQPMVVGPQGPPGEPGPATVNVGTTTTSEPGTDAEVSNAGDGVNAVFDFVIPRGDVGPQGPPGSIDNLPEGIELQANKGVAGGYAPLDAGSKVPAANLPSYVDDIVEGANLAAFPVTGETGKIYVALDSGMTYRWSGTTYVAVSDKVTSTGITDSTVVGRALVTAVDAKAARTTTDTERDFQFNVKDYGAVGNGVTVDNAGIAAALAAAKAAGGGIVFLPAGTYLVNQPLLMNGNNVTIQGAGRSASIIKTTGDHAILDVQNASGVTVRDLQVLGDGDVAKVLQRGIQCQNTTDSLFTNVWAKNLGYDGFCILWGNVNCTVSNCRASGCQDDGINVGGGTTSDTIGTVVVGNIVTDCLHVGIHISDRSSFSTVTGNTVAGCDKGIDTYQSAATTGLGSNTITGNTIRNCVTYGIFIRVSDRNIVAGNSVEGGDTGIFLDNSKDCTITGNIITNTKTYGLRANSACNDLIFADNKLVGTNTTSFVECPRTQFNGNNMRGAVNSVRVSATGVSSVVSNNVITNGTGIDIQIDAAGCVVSGNRIDALGTKSVWAAGSSARCVVTGNVISGGARGIEVASADGLVTGNSLSGQTAMGIYTYGARTQIADNHLWSTQLPFNMFNATDALIVNNVTVATVGANSVTENGGSGTILSNNRLDKPASLLGTAPIEIPLTQTPVYTVSNVTTDRAFDANATTIEELADVVGTLISDLRARGVVPKIQAGVFGPVAVDPDAPAEATPETPESNK